MAGSPLMGGLLPSAHPPRYRIGWLAVARAWRRQGVGRLAVTHPLSRVRRPATVSVVTFGRGVRLGFASCEPAENGPGGRSPQVYRRAVR